MTYLRNLKKNSCKNKFVGKIVEFAMTFGKITAIIKSDSNNILNASKMKPSRLMGKFNMRWTFSLSRH